jgi:predicted nucleic acid-binding protein
MPALFADAGVLIAASRNDSRAWAHRKEARARRIPLVIITPVLAQAWRGPRDANLARWLKGCDIEPLSEAVARRGGELCGQARTDDAIDACLVAQAAVHHDTIVTADPDDIRMLAVFVTGVTVIEL